MSTSTPVNSPCTTSHIPTLTPEQIQGYLARIQYKTPPAQIVRNAETLAQITTAHINHVPFENLTIHRQLPYSLDRDALYEKIVVKRQGGFCFELNGFLACLLHSLGFTVRLVDSCVNRGHYDDVMRVWSPWTHVIIIVTIDEIHYAVDVGFGAPPLQPIAIILNTVQTLSDGFKYRVVTSRPFASLIEFAPPEYTPASESATVTPTTPVDQSQDDYLIFERWSEPKSAWIPRIMIHARLQDRAFPDYFLSALERVQHRNSPFRADVLVTLIPRAHVLWTLSGHRLIETVTPYGERREQTLEDDQQAIEVIKERFGMDLTTDTEAKHPLHFGGIGYEPPPTPTASASASAVQPVAAPFDPETHADLQPQTLENPSTSPSTSTTSTSTSTSTSSSSSSTSTTISTSSSTSSDSVASAS